MRREFMEIPNAPRQTGQADYRQPWRQPIAIVAGVKVQAVAAEIHDVADGDDRRLFLDGRLVLGRAGLPAAPGHS